MTSDDASAPNCRCSPATVGVAAGSGALVGTEPVAKKFEMRQLVLKEVIQDEWDALMELAGVEAECEITFPEIIAQDSTGKIKNLVLAEEVEAIDHQTMATGISQELGLTNYNYDEVQSRIANDQQDEILKNTNNVLISPLTAKAAVGAATPSAPTASSTPAKPSAVTKDDRAKLGQSRGF